MQLVSNYVNNIIRKIFNKKDPLLAEIIINWSKIVGIKFSKTSSPFKISTSREKGIRINILHVEVHNSGLAMEMSFQQEIIIERITVYLGFKAIHKLSISNT